jgi:hypothetical protein
MVVDEIPRVRPAMKRDAIEQQRVQKLREPSFATVPRMRAWESPRRPSTSRRKSDAAGETIRRKPSSDGAEKRKGRAAAGSPFPCPDARGSPPHGSRAPDLPPLRSEPPPHRGSLSTHLIDPAAPLQRSLSRWFTPPVHSAEASIRTTTRPITQLQRETDGGPQPVSLASRAGRTREPQPRRDRLFLFRYRDGSSVATRRPARRRDDPPPRRSTSPTCRGGPSRRSSTAGRRPRRGTARPRRPCGRATFRRGRASRDPCAPGELAERGAPRGSGRAGEREQHASVAVVSG